MTTIKRPMLAASATEEDIKAALAAKGELWISPKIDGVRGLVLGGKLFSRSMKPIPNAALNADIELLPTLGFGWLSEFDGELTVGPPDRKDAFLETTGALRRVAGEHLVYYTVFDRLRNPDLPYAKRLEDAYLCGSFGSLSVRPAELSVASSWDEVMAAEDLYVREWGYEGLILRDPMAPYKQGRSTVKEAGMLKLKRFQDAEAIVIGVQELLHNENPATVSEIGRTKRSSHKENKVAGGKLGALLVRHLETGVEFAIGTGFTDAQRRELWENGEEVVGKIVKFKSFPVGVKEAPRHPSFLGFREPWDMDRA